MTTITKLAQIANDALESADIGPSMRVSASGKTLFVEWEDVENEVKYSIPEHLAVEMLTALAYPDEEMDTQSGFPCLKSQYVLFHLGAI